MIVGRYIAVIICVLLSVLSVSLSISVGFLCGAGFGFLVLSAMCCVLIAITLLFAMRIAKESKESEDDV